MSGVTLNNKQRVYLKQILNYLETVRVPDTHLRVFELENDVTLNPDEYVQPKEYSYNLSFTKYAIQQALENDSYSSRDRDFFNSLKPIFRLMKHNEENRKLIQTHFGKE